MRSIDGISRTECMGPTSSFYIQTVVPLSFLNLLSLVSIPFLLALSFPSGPAIRCCVPSHLNNLGCFRHLSFPTLKKKKKNLSSVPSLDSPLPHTASDTSLRPLLGLFISETREPRPEADPQPTPCRTVGLDPQPFSMAPTMRLVVTRVREQQLTALCMMNAKSTNKSQSSHHKSEPMVSIR